ncbi:acyltransferase [Nitratireductor sp.]|nr:acyltransferase [Nitratireductor sp.]MCV0378324.1 acyltransferase [Nitratireductor sp.]
MRKAEYRPDIDGLRAIAVLSVLVYHLGFGIKGGFIGVDVFFVISGFLITGNILKDIENESFSFLSFFMKRLRRIYPALLVTVAATFIAGYLVMSPEAF